MAADLNVVSVQPAPRSVAAPVTTSISITFDKPVKPESITPLGSFWAFGRWSGTTTGGFSFSNGNQTVTLQPDRQFSAGEQVMVILSHDIEAADGTKLRAAGYSFQFWTATRPNPMDFQQTDLLTTVGKDGLSPRPYGGVATDLNRDGHLDLTIVNEDTADLRVFMNPGNGSGTFAEFMDPTFAVGDRASPSEPSDFNRDGFADLCVANINDGTVSVLLGNGDGTFASQQLLTVGLDPRGIAVLDVDGDGDVDIVNTNYTSDNLSLLINDGAGTFTAASPFEGGGAGEWALSAADMNHDGILDLVIGTQGSPQRIIVSQGAGAGSFSLVSSQVANGFPWMLNTGDLDGNGTEDVAVVNSASNRGVILLGDGAGNLAPPVSYSTDPFPLATDLGDLDGDGDLDWVTSSYSGDWQVRLNNGSGTFTFLRELAAPDAASCALMFDCDNDGDLDLALIDELVDVVFIMQNSGFTPVPAMSAWGVMILALLMATAGTVLATRRRRAVPR